MSVDVYQERRAQADLRAVTFASGRPSGRRTLGLLQRRHVAIDMSLTSVVNRTSLKTLRLASFVRMTDTRSTPIRVVTIGGTQ